MSVLLWLVLIVAAVAIIAVAMYFVRKSRRAGSVLAIRVSDRGIQ